MATTVLAVYQNGVLRPAQPLPLAEGETVQITVARTVAAALAPAEDEAVERIAAATTLEEWIAAANAAPPEADEYDLLAALNDNRRLSGDQRLLFAPEREGDAR